MATGLEVVYPSRSEGDDRESGVNLRRKILI
jgi:hypothetical protein